MSQYIHLVTSNFLEIGNRLVHLFCAWRNRSQLSAATRNGVTVRIVAFATNYFRQNPATGVDEPVAYLTVNQNNMSTC